MNEKLWNVGQEFFGEVFAAPSKDELVRALGLSLALLCGVSNGQAQAFADRALRKGLIVWEQGDLASFASWLKDRFLY